MREWTNSQNSGDVFRIQDFAIRSDQTAVYFQRADIMRTRSTYTSPLSRPTTHISSLVEEVKPKASGRIGGLILTDHTGVAS
jgi:hypothetical protein